MVLIELGISHTIEFVDIYRRSRNRACLKTVHCTRL